MKKTLIFIVSTLALIAAAQVQAATYTVNTTVDDNGNCTARACSIREAIMAANANPGHDTIVVAVSGVHALTLTSGSSDEAYGDLDINPNGYDALSISGMKHNLVIDASAVAEQAIAVHQGIVAIREATIMGGVSQNGGGIENHGTVNLLASVITGNNATAGGGVYNAGRLNILNYSYIDNNVAHNGGGVFTAAGGTTVLNSNSYIHTNSVASNGGGVYVGTGGRFLMAGSAVINNNTAANYGGGVHSDVALQLTQGEISENTAYRGGGIYADSVALYGMTIQGNSSTDSGGGVYSDGLAELYTTVVTENDAQLGGGGVFAADEFSARNSTFDSNTSQYYGGGVYSRNDTEISGSEFTNNISYYRYGGGLYTDCYMFSNSGTAQGLTVENSTFDGNEVYLGGSTAGGAALYAYMCNDSISNSSFTNNVSEGDSAVALSGTTLGTTTTNIDSVEISYNTASRGTSALYLRYKNATLDNVTIDSNAEIRNATATGGTVYFRDSDVEMTNSAVTNNSTLNGNASGIVTHLTTETVSLDNVEIDGNTGGTALYARGNLEVENSSLTNNSTPLSYGTIYFHNGAAYSQTMTMLNTTVSGNTGAGVRIAHSATSAAYIDFSTITNNSGYSTYPGGMYTTPSGSGNGVVEVSSSIVYGNTDSTGTAYDIDGRYETSSGYNIVGTVGSSYAADSTDQVGVNPQLSALSYSGDTQSQALSSSSSAVDAIPAASCTDYSGNPVSTDQRGSARPSGSACDIGAYEL